MGKDKLKDSKRIFHSQDLIQPALSYPPADHAFKGKWNKEFFKNDFPIVLELGCGRGEYAVNMAKKFPEKNFIGIDWKGARLWRGAKTGVEEKISNLGFLRIQIQNLYAFFGENEISEIWITFPDPQMQQNRERKRLTHLRFLSMYQKMMKPDGIIHLKTDSLPFYEYTLEVIAENKLKIIKQTADLYNSPILDDVLSIKTTYEQIWLKSGAKICYVEYLVNSGG
ncbi:MAG: tRNA (guanosine(46)-N7)-methyltransferase TrmB [Bacteroidetes bacterium]|nr:tRNA (guanosine(46)-N7)-methyltransferase TrmB [Bacteroidota bacterium]